ncbi:MAG: thiamine diphosphokinase [Desulfobacteraceae bacterium]
MKFIIVSSGVIKNQKRFLELAGTADKIVCADAGAGHLKSMGILPDVIIGDFDSIGPENMEFFKGRSVEMIQHSVKKDATDTELAAMWAIEHKACEIIFLGASGSRLDHTLANIMLLKKMADLNIKSSIIDDHNCIYLVNDHLTLRGTPGEFLSIIPLTEKVSGVTLEGLEFPLHNKEIYMGSSLGISNRFTAESAVISIRQGLLIVTKSKD